MANQINVEGTVKKAASQISSLIGLGTSATNVVGILADGVFKAVQLGRQIRAAQQKANADLEAKIRAAGILSTPIVVDLGLLELITFYERTRNFEAFPALNEFKQEADELNSRKASPETQALLKAAKVLVPILQDDPKLEGHPELAKIFDTASQTNSPNVRQLVQEYMRLFPEGELSYREHYTRLEGFWKDKLELELGNISRAQLEAQPALDQQVSELIKTAIFGDRSFADQALNLVKNLKDIATNKKG
jgi:hypothetical protein